MAQLLDVNSESYCRLQLAFAKSSRSKEYPVCGPLLRLDGYPAGRLREKPVGKINRLIGKLMMIQAFPPESVDQALWCAGPTSVAMGFEPQRRFHRMDIEQEFRSMSYQR